MKKSLQMMALVAMSIAIVSCSDVSKDNSDAALNSLNESDKVTGQGRTCASMEMLAKNMQDDPTLKNKMDELETFTKDFEQKKMKGSRVGEIGTLTIPVVVNVIYSNANENISAAQIQSQIDVLNRDFSGSNPDKSLIPSAFASSFANMEIKFILSSVVRRASTNTAWGLNDFCKKTALGGINATTPTTKLNLWVCNIGSGILGYAQFPGGNVRTDGVVISPQYFGTTGYVEAPYDKGRTAVHEIGHWLNLIHIWGDASCGNDQVADTPTQQDPNFGCTSFPKVSCSNGPNGDMFMNYMDYGNDLCLYMFTTGQKNRSRAIFAPNGPRASFNP